MTQIKPGFYKAKIYDYGIVATKTKGEPQLVITMEVDGNRYDFRQGFNNEVGLKIALETLARCGLENGEDIHLIAKGKESGVLDIETEYEAKIILERDRENPDVLRPKVNAIGLPGGDGIQNRVDENQAEQLLANLSLGASFNKIKEKMPARSQPRDDVPPIGW